MTNQNFSRAMYYHLTKQNWSTGINKIIKTKKYNKFATIINKKYTDLRLFCFAKDGYYMCNIYNNNMQLMIQTCYNENWVFCAENWVFCAKRYNNFEEYITQQINTFNTQN